MLPCAAGTSRSSSPTAVRLSRGLNAYTRSHDNRHKKFLWAKEDFEPAMAEDFEPAMVDIRRYARNVLAPSEWRASTLVRLIVRERCQASAAKRPKIPSNVVVAYAWNRIVWAG